MRIITANVNGIRAAARKGFFEWLATVDADIICLQETKAQRAQLTDPMFYPEGYHVFFEDAERKGYSGVAIYTREEPVAVHTSLGHEATAHEGRYLQIDFKQLSVASLYLPSGSSGDERQAVKFEFMDCLMERLKRWGQEERAYVICGDWNTVHRRIDIENWSGNQKNSGCLPEERAWMEAVFEEAGFADAFRAVDSREKQYTWWSNRGQAWAKNVGWRIDYHVVSQDLKDCVKAAEIYKEERFSDHAPLIIDYVGLEDRLR